MWHFDRFGRNDFLGEVKILLGDYQGGDIAPAWYSLVPAVCSLFSLVRSAIQYVRDRNRIRRRNDLKTEDKRIL